MTESTPRYISIILKDSSKELESKSPITLIDTFSQLRAQYRFSLPPSTRNLIIIEGQGGLGIRCTLQKKRTMAIDLRAVHTPSAEEKARSPFFRRV